MIGPGKWVGLDNYFRLASDRLFSTAVWNTIYFVILSVMPGTLLALVIALGVNRLKGWMQSIVLAAFFLPYILPVSVVYRIWGWMFDKDFGVAQYLLAPLNGGQHLSVFRTVPLFMPAVAFITVWWCLGFSLLLFIAGLRNISSEIYEAAELDGAGRWRQFRRITWPLIWPVTVLVFTIQLILQLKIFDQVYLFAQGGRIDANMVMVQYILRASLPAEQGRPWQPLRRRSVRGDRGPVRAAVPAPARARANVERFRSDASTWSRRAAAGRLARLRHFDVAGLVITFGTLIGAVIWAFPLYWGLVTTFKPENEIVRPGVRALAGAFHL